jgi:hypothetical protein
MTAKRAWRDARSDYYVTEASIRRARGAKAWKFFIALLLSGALYKLCGG